MDNIKADRTPEDLLVQTMLDFGILLSEPITVEEIAGKRVFNVADGFLLACFDRDVTDETVTAIAKRKPYYAVFRDASMAEQCADELRPALCGVQPRDGAAGAVV